MSSTWLAQVVLQVVGAHGWFRPRHGRDRLASSYGLPNSVSVQAPGLGVAPCAQAASMEACSSGAPPSWRGTVGTIWGDPGSLRSGTRETSSARIPFGGVSSL